MRVEIMDADETHVGLKVFDNDDNEHRLTVKKDTGEIDIHEQDVFPLDPEERTDEENVIMRQVGNRAQYEAHRAFDATLYPAEWRPEYLERAIKAIQSCPDDRFEEFRPLYEGVQDPAVDVPVTDVGIVTSGFTVTDDDQIDEIGPVIPGVITDDGSMDMRGPDPNMDADFVIKLEPMRFEWPFGERFRDLLVRHFKCQIRDAYINMGDDPPEEYRIKGFGKISFHGMDYVDSEMRSFEA